MESKGHVCYVLDFEFLRGPDGTLYRAPKANPLDTQGYRMGARFECMPRQDGHKMYLKNVWGVEV